MLQKRNRSYFFAIACAVGMIAGCAPPSDQSAGGDSDRIRVIATFSILEDWVREVGGDRIDVQSMVPREGDPHTFEATPRDSRTLTRASLIFEIGQDFEPWLDRLYRASRSEARRVSLTEGIELLPVQGGRTGIRGHKNGHPSERDPHLWHDVGQTRAMVTAIRDALADADPENADTYSANAERYLERLEELDEWILSRIATLPPEQRKLFTNHDVFRYFAYRYGFEVVGTALAASTTEVFDPSASEIGAQIRTLRNEEIPAVFPEKGSCDRLISRIAGEAGTRVGPSLYTDSLSRESGDAPGYIEMMRYNVDILVQHLSGEEWEP